MMKSGGEEKIGAREKNEGELRGKVRNRGVLLVGKSVKAGPSTPVPPWRTFEEERKGTAHDSDKETLSSRPFTTDTVNKNPCSVSARKLAATLWEFQHYLPVSAKMHRGGNGRPPHPAKSKGLEFHSYLPESSPSSPDQTASESSLKRHVDASLMQRHRSIVRNNHTLEPESLASYGSSVEIKPYKSVVFPSRSVDLKEKKDETSFTLKTSTELLKVLNRIWGLEEQHTKNISLIKALKAELDQSRAKVNQLLQDRYEDRTIINDLMKQITENNLVRKTKDHDRISDTIQSMKEELEGERKLRKRSESLHRKLSRELSEVKNSLSRTLTEMEGERKSRELLENLCDEFAKGIKEYEHEVRILRHKSDKDLSYKADHDRLILHTSESWLDERTQMKLRESQLGYVENNSIIDKLRPEIETLLRSKSNVHVGDENSDGSSSYAHDINKPNHFHEDEELLIKNMAKSNMIKARDPSSLQGKFIEKMALARDSNKHEGKLIEDHGPSNTNHMINNLMMNMKGHDHDLEEKGGIGNSPWRSRASPVQQWMTKLGSNDLDLSESSSKLVSGIKENTLKAKLLEARSKGQRSRVKATKGSC